MRKLLLAGGLAVILAAGFIVSGCLISPPDSPNLAANILKLSPKYLETLPAGSIYEGWLVTGDTVDGVWRAHEKTEWKSFGRFNWDSYDYQPIDAAGNIIENRFDAQVNVFDYHRIFITIEPTGAEETDLPSGIVILQGDVDYMNGDADLEHPISTADIDDFRPEIYYWIYSQSDGEWYDNPTGTKGIWFGEIQKGDLVVFDTLCRDEDDPDVWYICDKDAGEKADSIFWCTFIGDIDTSYSDPDTTINDSVDPPETTIVFLTTDIDTTFVPGECDPDPVTWDSIGWHDTIYLIPDGDTAMTPSLGDMPPAVEGWKYEAWIIFKEGSGYEPLSLGRFSRSDEADDDSSHCIPGGYDWNFTVPGEDFFENVPDFGSLDVVRNEEVEKLFITVEPNPDFDRDHPFKQLIMFSARIPKERRFFEIEIAGDDTTITDRPLLGNRQFDFTVRDLGFDLNEGHRWPMMHVALEREMVIE